MDKAELIDFFEKFTATYGLVVPGDVLRPLFEDITDWKAWNRLHAMSVAYPVDVETVRKIRSCAIAATRGFLGDTA